MHHPVHPGLYTALLHLLYYTSLGVYLPTQHSGPAGVQRLLGTGGLEEALGSGLHPIKTCLTRLSMLSLIV